MAAILDRRTLLAGAAASSTLPLIGGPASAADPLKVGFLYVGPVGDFGYTHAHDVARKKVQEAYGDKIKTNYVENVPEGPDAERVLRQLAQEGNKIIFATSFGFMNATAKVAKALPKTYFEHGTGYMRGPNLATASTKAAP